VIILGSGVGIGAWAVSDQPPSVRLELASMRDSCQASELLVGVRGSGETNAETGGGGLGDTVSSVFHGLIKELSPQLVGATAVDYLAVGVPTAMDGAVAGQASMTYANSYQQGLVQLMNELYLWNHKCPSYRFVLAGYSQGADVLGGVLAQLNPAVPAELSIIHKIDGVAFFGDPHYNPADGATAANSGASHGGLFRYRWLGSGSTASRTIPGWLTGRARSWCRTGDPVCDFDPARYSACAKAIAAIVANNEVVTAGKGLACFNQVKADIGLHTTYASMPDPTYPHEGSAWLKQMATHPSSGGGGAIPPAGGDTGSRPCETIVSDVNIPDGSALPAAQTARKTWRLHNCGATWSGVNALLVTGSGAPRSFEVPAVGAGQNGDVSVTFTAPSAPGRYRWTYQLSNTAGASSGSFWVDFVVDVPSPAAAPPPVVPSPAAAPPPPIAGDVPPASDPGQSPLPAGAQVLGGIDLQRYCHDGWGLSPQLRFDVTWGWRCSTSPVAGAGQRVGDQDIDMNAACSQQYTAAARSHYRSYRDPNSWFCWTP